MSHDPRAQSRGARALPANGRRGSGVRHLGRGLVRGEQPGAAGQPAAEGGAGGKASKYGNRKTVVDGVTFDSKREAARWRELTLLQRAGHITELQRQVVYVLAPSVKFAGAKRAQPALRLMVDFGYREAGQLVLEDVKGVITTAFTIKRHLLKALYGVEVRLFR